MRLSAIESEKKLSQMEAARDDYLFPEQVAILKRSTKFSAEDEIAAMLVKLSVARQATVNAATLDLCSTELSRRNFDAVRTAIDKLCVTTRRDGETAFPDMATLLAAVDAATRQQDAGRKFTSCEKCANGIVVVIRKGEQFARDCECFEAWKE